LNHPLTTSLRRAHRLAAILLLGFVSGLPLALTGQAMQAWLAIDGIDIATIGFFGLVGTPYTFKFLWAPLMDRFEPPLLGRRRGWMVLSQLALASMLFLMSFLSPAGHLGLFAGCALLIAFLSASQDVVIDAYRTDLLPESERGLGASLHVFSYRLAMIVSGGISLIWAEQWNSWSQVYAVMGVIMLVAAAISFFFVPSIKTAEKPPASNAGDELRGFAVMLIGVINGYFLARSFLMMLGLSPTGSSPVVQLLFIMSQIFMAIFLAWWFAHLVNPDNTKNPKRKMAITLLGGLNGYFFASQALMMLNWQLGGFDIVIIHAIAIILFGFLFSKLSRFETLNASLASYFSMPGAVYFLVLIILYKLGDAFAGSLTTTFLLRGLLFSQTEVGIANKLIGIWLTIFGAVLGGTLMLRIGLYKSLLWFGILQLISNFGFVFLATLSKGVWGSIMLPPFDWVIITLHETTSLDCLLLVVIATENIAGGMGTVALVALLMALCNQRFSATHYALLSALAVIGRIYVGPVSGVLVESIGWKNFYLFSVLAGVPGVVMVWWMRQTLINLSQAALANNEEN